MIVAYLLAGIAVGLMSALWGWTAGFSVLAIFGFYALGGAMGMAATIAWAAAMCHRSPSLSEADLSEAERALAETEQHIRQA